MSVNNEAPAGNKHIGKMAAVTPQKVRAKLEVVLPQELCGSRHFANMPTVSGQASKTATK